MREMKTNLIKISIYYNFVIRASKGIMSQKQFILFLQPYQGSFYSFCEELGILVKQTPPQNIQRLVAEDIKHYHFLIGQKLKDSLCSFQTRPIPSSFLTNRKNRFPIYSTQQPLYESMLQQYKFKQQGNLAKNQHKQFLSVRVYFGSIRNQLQESKSRRMNGQFIECVDIKFIASVNEIIRTVCRLILQQQKIVITTSSSNSRLILKVRNREQYMYGNEPISSYNCVLECLKQDKILQVEIFEADVNKQRQQFRKFIFYRQTKDIENNIFNSYPWSDLNQNQYCGFFMWHMPDAFYMDNKYIQSLNTTDPTELENNKSKIRVRLADKQKQLRARLPRFLIKESMKAFMQKRREEITKKLVSIDGTTIYSGECAFVFTIQTLGIKNLFSLLHLTQPQKIKSKKGLLKLTNNKEPGEENITSLQTPFRKYNKLMQIKKQGKFPIIPYQFNIVVNFFYNSSKIPLTKQKSPMYLVSNIVQTDFKFHWKLLSSLMLETSIVFKVKFYSKQGERVTCGIGVIKPFDQFGFLRQGRQKVQLQAHENVHKIKLGCYEHLLQTDDPKIAIIYVNFPKFRHPVRWTLNDIKCMTQLGYIESKPIDQVINIEQKMSELIKLLNYDPLKMMNYSQNQKKMLKLGKKYYKHQSQKLLNYLYSVNWTNPLEVNEAYNSIKQWEALKPVEAIFLLNPRISDEKIRYFAVKALDQMKNYEFCLYSNQITQALVSFQTHENPLIDLIIQRSCQDPFVVAQEYFWQFWNRIGQRITSYRFSLYLQALILTCPIRKQFWKQVKTNQKLVQANQNLVKKTEGWQFYKKNEKFKTMVKVIESELIHIDPNMDGFTFPIRPEMTFKRLIPESSKMFDSKKLPFALACTSIPQEKNEEDKNKKQKPEYLVMFKYGDDIKQDHLVLQIFTIFNKIWVEAGLDFKMNIYKVLSTGDGIGFIEIVQNAENSSYIHKQYSENLMQAFDDRTTQKYLKAMNPDDEKFKIARENFIRSSAGYLVATYIMGIGDRHSGNYMVQKNGKFFHIDFGHILGNFKTKFNIKRQRTPFVFTSEFSYMMGGEKSNAFARFEVLCANAYNALRKNAHLIINLLIMIVGSKIPQIENYGHLQYAIDKLNLEMSDLQASEHIVKEIKKTLESQSRKYDNFVHEKMRVG